LYAFSQYVNELFRSFPYMILLLRRLTLSCSGFTPAYSFHLSFYLMKWTFPVKT